MTPKQQARLGVFHIEEAILEVLEQASEGLEPEGVSAILGISDYLSIQGILTKLQREGSVEVIRGNRWKIVSSDDSNIWTAERFRELISGEKYEKRYISKGQVGRLSELGADLMNFIGKKEWGLPYEFRKLGFYFYFKEKRPYGKRPFGVKLNIRRPRLCIWMPKNLFIAKENEFIRSGQIDRRYGKYYDLDGGYAVYPSDVEVVNIEQMLEFAYAGDYREIYYGKK